LGGGVIVLPHDDERVSITPELARISLRHVVLSVSEHFTNMLVSF